MIKKSKHTATKSHQITKEDSKVRNKKQRIDKSQKTMNKIASPYLSIITLNVNQLNFLIKREWLNRKKNPMICCLKEIHSSFKDIYRLRAKGCKIIFQENANQKKAEIAIILSENNRHQADNGQKRQKRS